MKSISIIFDSMNRHLLPTYGCEWVHAPNFVRLAQRAATFDRAYGCSLASIPARRDLHSARPNFLHRPWGPLEPFDDSVPQMLRDAGVYTHLVTDNYHYWGDAGATYHTRYDTFDLIRGQEADRWNPSLGEAPPDASARGCNAYPGAHYRQERANRRAIEHEEDHPLERTFASAMDFIRRHAAADRWHLDIDAFDPHQPFVANQRYRNLYPGKSDAIVFDWPPYGPVTETPDEVQHVRREYAALVSQCDAALGRVLDAMDELDMWRDTLLIVWSDHGVMLGEHGAWAKFWQPWYEELSHVPLCVWDPRVGVRGERRSALVQPALDIGPTLLELHGVHPAHDMLGHSLAPIVAGDQAAREAAIFGMHGAQLNVTDGRYVYMRGPISRHHDLVSMYTLMPMSMRNLMPVEQLRRAEFVPPFAFTKGCPLMRLPGRNWAPPPRVVGQRVLWDLEADPGQTAPIDDRAVEARMIELAMAAMQACDAPASEYERLGFRPLHRDLRRSWTRGISRAESLVGRIGKGRHRRPSASGTAIQPEARRPG